VHCKWCDETSWNFEGRTVLQYIACRMLPKESDKREDRRLYVAISGRVLKPCSAKPGYKSMNLDAEICGTGTQKTWYTGRARATALIIMVFTVGQVRSEAADQRGILWKMFSTLPSN
jgi:hypothetical protein